MSAAKPVYLYTVSAISLLVLAVGLYNLIAAVMAGFVDAFGATTIGGSGSTGREQISLAIAMVLVGAPVFALHWSLVGRGWRGTDDVALQERRSPLRAFHLGLVATVALAVAIVASLQVMNDVLTTAFGVDREGGGVRTSDALAMLLVALPIWWYHVRRRNADLRHDVMAGAAAWLTRFHRYAWAFVGLMLVVSGASGAIETVASVLIGRYDFGAADRWWLVALAGSISTIVIGLGVFLIHVGDARLAVRDAAIIGEDDRTSAVYATYFGAVILVAMADVGLSVVSSLAGLGQWVLGLADGTGVADFLELVVGPLLVAVPFAIAGWLHWNVRRHEAADRSPAALASAERLSLHVAAGVGIAFLAVGTGQLLGRLLDVVFGSPAIDDLVGREIVWFVALAVVGAAVWIPAWLTILRHRGAQPLTERRASAGRAYLYLVVGASLMAAIPSAVFTLYRLIDTLLGGRGIGLGSELAIPIAVVIVASVIALYHGRLVVSDLRLANETDRAIEAEGATAPSVTTPVPPLAVSIGLTLRGPAGTDLDALANTLREHLPDGVVLEGRAVQPLAPVPDPSLGRPLQGRPRPV